MDYIPYNSPTFTHYIMKFKPICISQSTTAIIAPRITVETITTADCLNRVVLSSHVIFLNSPFSSWVQLFLRAVDFSSLFAIKPILLHWSGTILFPCVLYASCRICSTSLFPFCLDAFSYPLSYCNYAVYNPDMPMLF